jgi:hypothetical protein
MVKHNLLSFQKMDVRLGTITFFCLTLLTLTTLMTLTTSTTLTTPTLVGENVIFEKVNDITTTRSKWLVAIQIDLDPYRKLMRRLDSSIEDIQTILFKKEVVDGKMNERLLMILHVMGRELEDLMISRSHLHTEFTEIQAIHRPWKLIGSKQRNNQRPTRALLGIIGKGLNYLFGTLTEADISALKENIKIIATSQRNLIHVVNGSLSILKKVQGEVIVNRKTLNAAIDSLNIVADEARNTSIGLSDLDRYVQTYTALDRTLSEIHGLMNIIRDHNQNLKLQINMLSLGHLSPTVIRPRELRKLLGEIKKDLDSRFKLPFEPEEDIWTFYKTVTCTTLFDTEHLTVVISIPLLDNEGTMEVYKVHNLPLPFNGPNQHIQSKYELETNYLAVSRTCTHFAVLSEAEAETCSVTLRPYCTFRSPAYSINTEMCVIQIFMNNREKIKMYCKEVIIPRDPFPRAEYLTDGHWLVTTDIPLTFSVLCSSTKSRDIITKVPMDIVILDMTCSAYNPRLTLLPYYNRESHYNMTEAFTLFLKQYNGDAMSLWKTFELAAPNTTIIIPPKLKEMKEIPVDQLIDELDKYKLTLKPMPIAPRYWICALGTFIPIVILALCIRFRHKIKLIFKSNVQKWSVKRGNMAELSGSPKPSWRHMSGPRPSSTDRWIAPDNEDSILKVTRQADFQQAANYLAEKYGTSLFDLTNIDNGSNDIEPNPNHDNQQRPVTIPEVIPEIDGAQRPLPPKPPREFV